MPVELTYTCPDCRKTSPLVSVPVICPHCGAEHARPAPRRPPGIVTSAANYAGSLARWVASGRPVRTTEEVELRRDICRKCPTERLDENGVCSLCGCPVIRPKRWGDKLEWATESCPEGHWS